MAIVIMWLDLCHSGHPANLLEICNFGHPVPLFLIQNSPLILIPGKKRIEMYIYKEVDILSLYFSTYSLYLSGLLPRFSLSGSLFMGSALMSVAFNGMFVLVWSVAFNGVDLLV